MASNQVIFFGEAGSYAEVVCEAFVSEVQVEPEVFRLNNSLALLLKELIVAAIDPQ